ncbi:capsid protein [Proteiniclasticum sp. SCR006]|uniref:Capsid protein n=1 Tax=Proteiniclasticum aestuarii TaxID=2817862 RepID=A0A939H525_9CLOT|nr:phage minor capsid protein [Proteiniclasticum aestuarii]MBO1264362.1 capsid protein [Proteiniclasticum aestuarii]
MKKKYNIRTIFEEMELYLLASMARNLSRHEGEEIKEGFKFEMWQSAKLRDLERFRRENKRIIDEFSPAIEKTVKERLMDTYRKSRSRVQSVVIKLSEKLSVRLPGSLEPVIDGLKGEELKETLEKVEEAAKKWKETPTPIDDNFFRTNDKKFDALIEATQKDMKKVNTSVLRKMDDVYRQTIFKAQVYHNNGVVDLNKAVDMATKDFLKQGITSIKYSNGREVNIASYAEMALRTANHRSYLMGEGSRRKELGISTVIVTPHATACELCRPWQGAVLIDDVYSGGKQEDGEYPLLSKAIEAGLFHPNCEDILATWFPGINTIPTVPDPERSEKWYKEAQKQRRLERAIRDQKRVVVGTLDEENMVREKKRLRELQKQLREHLKYNSQLRRKPEREG